MKAIIPQLKKNINNPIYLQLYDYIREGIINNELMENEKLPSIRTLATELKISVTTVNLAYQQLLVEGYIYSKPQSGYFVSHIAPPPHIQGLASGPQENMDLSQTHDDESFKQAIRKDESLFFYDSEAFDFVKWKKSLTKVLNDHSQLLLSEGNPQGEYSLRYEIYEYLYRIRGISSRSEDILIGAGTQQIIGQLSKLILIDNIKDLVIEKPGYSPAHSIFNDYGLNLHSAAVKEDGISLEKIPTDKRCAVYTSPSNQFPTGAVMPAGKRYELLELAGRNNSYIIEDDYDSELRYFGKPIPPLKSLDKNDSVIYLSSFSSTLFPAVKISYMVLPRQLSAIFEKMKGMYTQTCSKTEQLALAYYMESGNYHSHVRRLRRLYTQKLQATISAFKKYARKTVSLIHSSSGINMLIEVKTKKSGQELCDMAKTLGISTEPLDDEKARNQPYPRLVLHFHRIPLEKIEPAIEEMVRRWGQV